MLKQKLITQFEICTSIACSSISIDIDRQQFCQHFLLVNLYFTDHIIGDHSRFIMLTSLKVFNISAVDIISMLPFFHHIMFGILHTGSMPFVTTIEVFLLFRTHSDCVTGMGIKLNNPNNGIVMKK